MYRDVKLCFKLNWSLNSVFVCVCVSTGWWVAWQGVQVPVSVWGHSTTPLQCGGRGQQSHTLWPLPLCVGSEEHCTGGQSLHMLAGWGQRHWNRKSQNITFHNILLWISILQFYSIYNLYHGIQFCTVQYCNICYFKYHNKNSILSCVYHGQLPEQKC